MFFGLFTLWELILLPIILIILLIATAKEIWRLAIFTAITSAIVLHFCTNYSLFNFIYNSPGTAFMYIALYIIIGIIWSFYKWYMYVKERAKVFLTEQEDWKIRVQQAGSEQAAKRYHDQPTLANFTPDIAKNVDLIFGWAGFWPWSLLWALLDDAFRSFYAFIIKRLSVVYAWITKQAFKNTI